MTVALVILAFVAILLCVAAWLFSVKITGRRSPDERCTPDVFGLHYESLLFPSRDGVTLSGRLTGSPRHPAIIVCAGMFGSMDGDTAMLQPLVEAGFCVFQFDWRAHGESDGDTNTLGVREGDDLLGAVDLLAGRGVDRIGVLGFSFGGSVATRVTAVDQRVRCLVVDGGFVDLKHAFQGFMEERAGRLTALMAGPLSQLVLAAAGWRLGADLTTISPLEAAPLIAPRPVLLIHGADDPIVPRGDQDAIFAACGEPKTLWRVEGCAHREVNKKHPADYLYRVIGFFNETLR